MKKIFQTNKIKSFSNSSSTLLFFVIFLVVPSIALALPGDYAIYQDTNNSFDTNVSWSGVPFNNIKHEDSAFTQNANDIDVTLNEDGIYMGCYNVYAVNDTYANRMGWRVGLKNPDTSQNWHGSFSSNYRRDAENDEFGVQGCGFNVGQAGDKVRVLINQDSTNSAPHLLKNSISHFWLLQLDDNWEYIQLSSSAGQAVTTSYQDVQWDTLVAHSGSGSITHSTSVNNTTISLAEGEYLVMYNLPTTGSNGERTSISSNLLRGGTVQLPASQGYAYIRNIEGLVYGTPNRAFITSGFGADFTISFAAEGALSAGGQTLNPGTSITIIKLPSSVDYLSVYEETTSQNITSYNYQPLPFNIHGGSASLSDSFTWNNTTYQGTINKDGLYFFSAGGKTTRTTGVNRLSKSFAFWFNDVIDNMGRGTTYIRGQSISQDTMNGGFSTVTLAELSNTNSIKYQAIPIGSNLGGDDIIPRYRYGITAMNVDTLFEASVSTTGTQTSTVNVSSTNNNSGASFAIIDDTGHREVESITITENGTVNAQDNLDNIKLFYEMDTSAPYDCASESYAGTETQYGATDTDGFSGTNGTSTFTGSVTISTTSTMCVYVVFDVTSGASDGETIEFYINTPATEIVIGNGTIVTTSSVLMSGTTTIEASGSLTVDIVDAGGSTVASPSITMNPANFSFSNQTATGTFGTASQKIRVNNGTGTATWNLSLAASATTAFWNSAGTDYDFNDPTAAAGDGADADSLGGQMTLNPSGITITPEGGCTSTNISGGSLSSFSEGVTDSITLASAASGADTGCYWDITGVSVSQTIPAEQPAASDYNIDMVLSIIAS